MRMYCVFSREAIKLMGGNRGKLATQAGHAYLHAYFMAEMATLELATKYRGTLARKITCAVDTTEELTKLYMSLAGTCGAALIEDAGFTVFDRSTVTCAGFGPFDDEDVPEALKKLELLL